MARDLLACIPKVDFILSHKRIMELMHHYPRWVVLDAVRQVLDRRRRCIIEGQDAPHLVDLDFIIAELEAVLPYKAQPSLRRVINATGVILHTNLGRALLSQEALLQIREVALNYSNLEYDLEKGERGLRYMHVVEVLQRVTGAESAMVVNNNAAAVLLVLASLAQGREVVVSRGELIEIGGSFRLPEVMECSGAILREVGTTNRTRIGDYEGAIGEQTALLMKVHPSNYRVLGFTESVGLRELVKLGRFKGVPVYEDLGSGNLVDLRAFDLPGEPTVQESLNAGVDVLSFSGDKLLGGPQAGIILGRKEYIEGIRRHPLNRALRIGKLTLAGLEATLRLYMEPESLKDRLPTLGMLSTPVSDLMNRGKRLKERLANVLPTHYVLELREDVSYVGGGALPLAQLPTALVRITSNDKGVGEVEAAARGGLPPVIGRVKGDAFCLDMRTVGDEELEVMVKSLKGSLR